VQVEVRCRLIHREDTPSIGEVKHMSKKDRRIIVIAQCLVNPYCRVHLLGQNFPLSHELMDYLMSKRVGVIKYRCPETTAMGLQRNPQGRQQYDNIFFRQHCKDLLKVPIEIRDVDKIISFNLCYLKRNHNRKRIL
jgi:hypothetical protein